MSRPLDGVRVLAAEQMQALPYATQLLARLGADVVKVEPLSGESGRGSQPSMTDPFGQTVGATFLRNNLGKRSVSLDLKSSAGRSLFLRLVPRFDVVAENFKAGTMDRFGLGYAAVSEVHPAVIYVSVSGFGASGSPYRDWPAYASIVEAMSGIYEYMRRPSEPPRANPVGALGDISAALFASIGVLAALRHRDRTGEGQQVDVAMFDAAVAMTDIVTNLSSLGQERQPYPVPFILDSFRASDGWFVMQLVREHQFGRLAEVVGRPEWASDPRFATRAGWGEHLESVLRPGIEAWAASRTKTAAAAELTAAGRRCRAVLGRGRGAGRSPPRGPEHGRGDGADGRRRRTGAHARQPGEALEGARGRRDPRAVGGRAHRFRLARGAGLGRRRDREAASRCGDRMKWFASPVRWQRVAAFVGVVVAVLVLMTVAGMVLGLANGFGRAQYQSALWLADHADRLEDWDDSAGADLYGFIPFYVALGCAAVVVASRRRWPAVTLLLLSGIFDVLETVKVRDTLGRLLDGQDPVSLVDQTTTTAMLSGAKWALGAAAIVVLGFEVIGRDRG